MERELSDSELDGVSGGAAMVEYALLLFAILVMAAVPIKSPSKSPVIAPIGPAVG